MSYSGAGSTANGFGTALTNPAPGRNTQGRENPTISIDDTLNWLKGSHSVSMGGTFTHVGLHSYSQNVVPTVTPGIPTGDPALGMFVAANFPGASTSNLLEAQNLYALLTGHIFRSPARRSWTKPRSSTRISATRSTAASSSSSASSCRTRGARGRT